MMIRLILSVVLIHVFTSSALCAPSVAESKEKKKTTEVSFEDVLVQGKYHFSDEAVTTVEQDK
ncbi:MAG: hypothetical protein K2X47_04635, partial [Bdellovibrionales bacterium]|nr:hypothetical protein [Bdellovibrionales bacterium]